MASAAAAVMPRSVSSASAMTAPNLASTKCKPVLSIDASNLARPKSSVGVPTIVITPPDAPPCYSSAIPEQQYEKTVLFVPVKTEELGWDEHGLYWNGTYAYPVHQIYDKEGQPIGRRRKGPRGYRFEEYYDNKRPRRCSHLASSEDTVEEASVRFQEPAPARIERSDKATSFEHAEIGPEEVTDVVQDDTASPTSPTLSLASDVTETEDSSSVCDDSNSLWSRNDAGSDDEGSECTSPGVMSPPFGVDKQDWQPETLCNKLSDLSPADKNTTTPWLPLGTLPSSSVGSLSRSHSLPATRVSQPELSTAHQASSTPVVEQRRHSSACEYSSIIHDLATSPYASSRSSNVKSPFRSATLPRSPSRTSYSKTNSTLLRPPPSSSYPSSSYTNHTSSTSYTSKPKPNQTIAASRVAGSDDFSAGWSFESHSAMLHARWDDSSASHY